MSNTKRIVSVLLALCLLLLAVPAVTLAESATNYAISVTPTNAEVGDTVTVTLSNKAMTASSTAAGFKFDKAKLTCTAITGADEEDAEVIYLSSKNKFSEVTVSATVAEANEKGLVSFTLAGAKEKDYDALDVIKATFTVTAGGKLSFTLFEDTSGTSAFKADPVEGASKEVTVPVVKDALTGKPTITGTATYGETLTADVSSLNDSTNITLQWTRGGSDISGATSATYALTADDIGKKIAVKATATDASEYAGTVTSDATADVAKADAVAELVEATAQAAALVGQDIDETSIKIGTVGTGVEYSIDNKTTWGTSLEFTGLTVNSTYKIYARYAETNTNKASNAVLVFDGKTKDHEAGEAWFPKETDDGYHYHKCTGTCGNILMDRESDEKEAHTFDQSVAENKYLKSAANCQSAAVYYKSCVCGVASTTDTFTSGDPDTTVHTFDQKTKDNQVAAANCHIYAIYKMTCVCGAVSETDTWYDEASGFDTSIHDGETEVRDAKPATCKEAGYTGDTYCKGCGNKIADGQATDIDPDNHVNTEIVGKVDATTEKEGYTGDKVCKDCETVLEKGKVIEKLPEEKKEDEKKDDKKDDDQPKSDNTGDASNVWLWVVLMMVSTAGVCGAVATKKRVR